MRTFRVLAAGGLFAAVLAGAGSVSAADYPDGLRGSQDWNYEFTDEPSPLSFEFGLRYFYSRGSHNMRLATGATYESGDTSHILEGHLRINDASTYTYVSALAGFAVATDTTYSTPATGGTITGSGGRVAYAGADFGYLPFGTDTFRTGGLIGYRYMNESPDMGRISFTTAGGGGDSSINNIEINALRLGLAAEAEFSDFVTVRAEGAVIPYAHLHGTYGAFYQAPFLVGLTPYQQGSAGTLEGNLYGAQAEVTLGIKPWGNFSFNLGARASYLTGNATMTSTARQVGTPATSQGFITRTDALSFIRYGVLAGLSAEF